MIEPACAPIVLRTGRHPDVWEDGNELSFGICCPEQERAALLGKMDAYCLEQTSMALADFRTRYPAEAQRPHRPPAWPSCERAVGPVWALCAGFWGRAGPGPAGPKSRPVGARFCPGLGVRF